MRIHFHRLLRYYGGMKENLKQHFLKIGPRRFVVATVFLLITLDILNSIYLKLAFAKNDLSGKMVHMMIERMKLSTTDLDQNTLREIGGLVDKSLDFFLFVVFINNLFFYLFYLRKKLWAQGYVLAYALTAGIFSMAMIFDGYGMGAGWLIYNLITIPLYFYLYTGIKLLRDETTLVPEKKAL